MIKLNPYEYPVLVKVQEALKHMVVNCASSPVHNRTAVYNILAILKKVNPKRVTIEHAYIHAYMNGQELSPIDKAAWSEYHRYNYKAIEREIVLMCLSWFKVLSDPLRSLLENNSDFTIAVPNDIMFIINNNNNDYNVNQWECASTLLRHKLEANFSRDGYVYYPCSYTIIDKEALTNVSVCQLLSKVSKILYESKYDVVHESDIEGLYDHAYMYRMSIFLDVVLSCVLLLQDNTPPHPLYDHTRDQRCVNVPFISNEIAVCLMDKITIPYNEKTHKNLYLDAETIDYLTTLNMLLKY